MINRETPTPHDEHLLLYLSRACARAADPAACVEAARTADARASSIAPRDLRRVGILADRDVAVVEDTVTNDRRFLPSKLIYTLSLPTAFELVGPWGEVVEVTVNPASDDAASPSGAPAVTLPSET